MPRTLSRRVPLSLLLAGALALSGCSVLEGLGIGTGAETPSDETVVPESDPGLMDDDTTDDAPALGAGVVLPTCDTLYSSAQNTALLDQVRVNIGDTSDGDFGYGTTNRELVGLLKSVRGDLRLSCTWYLPASESVSVTSVAILDPEVAASVNRVLTDTGAVKTTEGGGTLWNIASTTSDESSEYIATESHFLAPVPCPASLAETTCIGWFTTNYSFGQAENLTVDAARKLGVYTN